MIGAVDTSVLLDILKADPRFGLPSKHSLEKARREGALIVCPIVISELRPFFGSDEETLQVIDSLELQVVEFGVHSSLLAGALWKDFRRTKTPRTRMMSDFLIGAHALIHSDFLITRDSIFFKKIFRELKIREPS